jgi:hypothetical protein
MTFLRKTGIALALLMSMGANAQDFMGFNTSHYAGLQSINANPANMVGGGLKLDVSIYNFDFNFGNNYMGFQKKGIGKGGTWSEFRNKYVNLYDVPNVDIYTNVRLQLPSMTLQFGKNAICLTADTRFILNLDNVATDIARHSAFEGNDQSLWNKTIHNDEFRLQGASWLELGAGYGREVLNIGQHRLNAALRLKFLLGGSSFFTYADNLELSFPNSDSINLVNSSFSYGASSNLVNDMEAAGTAGLTGFSKLSMGLDLGATYEFRKNPDDADYFVKAGLAINDIGRLNFSRRAVVGDFTANVTNFDLNVFDNVDNLGQFDSTLLRNFSSAAGGGTYTMRLPTALNWSADVRLAKYFGFNLTHNVAFDKVEGKFKLHGKNTITFTPRVENKWFGAYLPITFGQFGEQNVGLAARLGPVYFGSSNGLNFLFSNSFRQVNFYGGLKVPIGKKQQE